MITQINYNSEPASIRFQRIAICNCGDCTRRRSIEHVNELIKKADKRLRDENLGLTDSWKE